jgi:N-acetyl-anhydromuramyl-L-alanine amidase AmpD
MATSREKRFLLGILCLILGGILPLTYLVISGLLRKQTPPPNRSSLQYTMTTDQIYNHKPNNPYQNLSSDNKNQLSDTTNIPLNTERPENLNPNYQWHNSPNFDHRPAGVNIDTIILHATELPFYNAVLQVFRSPDSKVSSHYTIDRDGTVYCHVAEDYRAWHAGASQMPDGRSGVNDFSIGIELVNNNDGDDPYPELQINALKTLIKEIKGRHKIENLHSHATVAVPPGRKKDPLGFPWQEIKQIL